MTEAFLKKVVENFPDLVGKVLYLCPLTRDTVNVVLNANGTISIADRPDERFRDGRQLLLNIHGPEFTESASKIGLSMEPNRKVCVKSLLDKKRVAESEPRRSKKSGSIAPCEGLKFNENNSWLLSKCWSEFEDKVSRLDDRYVSKNCSGMMHISRGRNIRCHYCDRISHTIKKHLNRVIRGGLICPGVDPSKYQEILSTRKSFSSKFVTAFGKLHATACVGIVDSKTMWACEECKKARKRVNQRKRLPPISEESRLRFSGEKYLSAEDLEKKKRLIHDNLRKKFHEISKLKKKVARLETELSFYKPKYLEDRIAIKAIAKRLNDDTDRVMKPTCQWINEEENTCDFVGETCQSLWTHVISAHIGQQAIDTRTNERQYYCHWKECNRKKPFAKRRYIIKHIVDHTGDNGSTKRLLALREQLQNFGRPPTARRFGATRLLEQGFNSQAPQTNAAQSSDDDSDMDMDPRNASDIPGSSQQQNGIETPMSSSSDDMDMDFDAGI